MEVDFDFRNLEFISDLVYCKKLTITENIFVKISKSIIEAGSHYENNFSFFPEISLKSIKLFPKFNENKTEIDVRITNPFINNSFFKLFSSKIFSDLKTINSSLFSSVFLRDSLSRMKFIKMKGNNQEKDILNRVDDLIKHQSKKGVYQLFFTLTCLASGINEQQFKLEEDQFFNKLIETIDSLQYPDSFKKFLKFVLMRKDFEQLPSFSELKKMIDLNNENEFHDFFAKFKQNFKLDL